MSVVGELIERLSADMSDYSAKAVAEDFARRTLTGNWSFGSLQYSRAVMEIAYERIIEQKVSSDT